jgi:hypothetical protein
MKKKMFGLLVIAVIAVVAALNVNLEMRQNTLSAVALENVEALAYEIDVDVIWYPNKADEYDAQKQCTKECTAPGSGCAVVHITMC